VILSPWILYSDISGSVISPIISDLQPGAYLEGGGKIEVLHPVAPWLIVGGNIAVSERAYRSDVVATTTDKRHDTIVIPGASLIFPAAISRQVDLRLDYRYLWDSSNDPTKSFTDHIATASLIYRFDPTLPFWTQAASPPGTH
jgi:hypothetical protein